MAKAPALDFHTRQIQKLMSTHFTDLKNTITAALASYRPILDSLAIDPVVLLPLPPEAPRPQ